jgi:hypothetical protein
MTIVPIAALPSIYELLNCLLDDGTYGPISLLFTDLFQLSKSARIEPNASRGVVFLGFAHP